MSSYCCIKVILNYIKVVPLKTTKNKFVQSCLTPRQTSREPKKCLLGKRNSDTNHRLVGSMLVFKRLGTKLTSCFDWKKSLLLVSWSPKNRGHSQVPGVYKLWTSCWVSTDVMRPDGSTHTAGWPNFDAPSRQGSRFLKPLGIRDLYDQRRSVATWKLRIL